MSWSASSASASTSRTLARVLFSTASRAPCRKRRRWTACWRPEGLGLDGVIELRVDEDALMRRIESRIAEMKARGETLREDDNPEVLHNRLRAYREQTAPLIAYYRQNGLLRTVNGMAPIADVTAAIDRFLPADRPSGGRARQKKKRRAQPLKSRRRRRPGARIIGKKSARGAVAARGRPAKAKSGLPKRNRRRRPAPLSKFIQENASRG